LEFGDVIGWADDLGGSGESKDELTRSIGETAVVPVPVSVPVVGAVLEDKRASVGEFSADGDIDTGSEGSVADALSVKRAGSGDLVVVEPEREIKAEVAEPETEEPTPEINASRAPTPPLSAEDIISDLPSYHTYPASFQNDPRASIWIPDSSESAFLSMLASTSSDDDLASSPVLPKKNYQPSVASEDDSDAERVLETLGSIVTATKSELLSSEFETRTKQAGGRRRERERRKKGEMGRARSRSRSLVRFDRGGIAGLEIAVVNETEEKEEKEEVEIEALKMEPQMEKVEAVGSTVSSHTVKAVSSAKSSSAHSTAEDRSQATIPVPSISQMSLSSIPEPLARSPSSNLAIAGSTHRLSTDKELPLLPTMAQDFAQRMSGEGSVKSVKSGKGKRKGWFSLRARG
jgi:hypothetical protein